MQLHNLCLAEPGQLLKAGVARCGEGASCRRCQLSREIVFLRIVLLPFHASSSIIYSLNALRQERTLVEKQIQERLYERLRGISPSRRLAGDQDDRGQRSHNAGDLHTHHTLAEQQCRQ
jgi:hypothetical protein